ncbi:hypothetical protein ACSBR2_033144 [Camellia fascicularis]
MSKVRKIWDSQGDFEAIDLDSGFFFLKFQMKEDYSYVYTGGPWIVLDHYLTVWKWTPDFKPSAAKETTSALWIRFPQLPIKYYDEKVLFHISKTMGKPLKIDLNTTTSSRGKYARVCIEMDLNKPLISFFAIGLDTGRDGVNQIMIVDNDSRNKESPTQSSQMSMHEPIDNEEGKFGPRMLVDHKNRRLGPTSKPNGKSIQRPTYHNHRPGNGNHTSTSDLGPSLTVSMPNQILPKQVGRKGNMADKKSHRSNEGQSMDIMRRGNEFTSNTFDCLQSCATNTEMTTPSVIAAECIDGSVNLITSPTLAPPTLVPPPLNCDSTNITNPPPSTITLVTTPNPQLAPTVLKHRITCNQMYIAIDQEIEATHLIATEWWIEEARVKIDLNLESYRAVNHSLLIGPTRAMVNDRIRVRNIMEILDYCPLPDYPNSSSMKLLVWNCWGVGNKNEKRSFSTVQDHTRARKFQARLNRCKLMDLGCSGLRLTWTNGRQGLANTL